jgi:hypothetical protein
VPQDRKNIRRLRAWSVDTNLLEIKVVLSYLSKHNKNQKLKKANNQKSKNGQHAKIHIALHL